MSAPLRRSVIACFTLLITVMMVLSTTAPADALSRHQRERRVHHALRIALNQIGDPYVYGAAGPSSFDCSGLTSYAYGHAGLRLPRTSDGQGRYVNRIHRKNMRRGDLVFFYDGGGVYHVGINLGRRHGHRVIVHAPYPGKRVQRERIWTNNWFAGTLRYH